MSLIDDKLGYYLKFSELAWEWPKSCHFQQNGDNEIKHL